MPRKKKQCEPYHPGVLTQVIWDRLLEKNNKCPDAIIIREKEETQWIIYKGMKITNYKGIFKLQQYAGRGLTTVTNKFVLELIIKNLTDGISNSTPRTKS
jgi:hypothetical protein